MLIMENILFVGTFKHQTHQNRRVTTQADCFGKHLSICSMISKLSTLPSMKWRSLFIPPAYGLSKVYPPYNTMRSVYVLVSTMYAIKS